jgi:hypothetical protein
MRSTCFKSRSEPSADCYAAEARVGRVEVDVLAFLVACEHSPTRVELEYEIDSDPLDISNALHNLAAADLIDLNESHITFSRTSRLTMSMSGAVALARPRERDCSLYSRSRSISGRPARRSAR